MAGVEFGINDMYTAALHRDFTSIDNGVLTISPVNNPCPRAQNKYTIQMQGGFIDLRLLDVEPDAYEFCDYWEYLTSTESDHHWPLAKMVRYMLRGQGTRVVTGLHSMSPDWAKLAELVGLMYHFEEEHSGKSIHRGTEFREISEQLAKTINGDMFPGNGTWRKKGLPVLQTKITSFVSELRFAQEVSQAGYDFTFLEQKGDIRIETTPPLTIDVTHRYPGFGIEIEREGDKQIPKASGVPDRLTRGSVASAVTRTMTPAVFRKFNDHDREIDGIAVDTTRSLSGAKFMGFTRFTEEPPSVGDQIDTMVEAKQNGKQPILNFHHVRGADPHTIATCTTRRSLMHPYKLAIKRISRRIQRQINRM